MSDSLMLSGKLRKQVQSATRTVSSLYRFDFFLDFLTLFLGAGFFAFLAAAFAVCLAFAFFFARAVAISLLSSVC
jgi:hypothetical protein